MGSVREQLTNMFIKVMAGTVSREEGTMLINHLAKEDPVGTISEIAFLRDNPPPNVFPKTILHTVALARNKAFFKLMVESLDHKNEEVSILAAEEMARLHTGEAKSALIGHLNSEAYHVRKASAAALAKGFGAEGIEILKNHVLSHEEPFFRSTSAQGLLIAGRKGVEALLEILNSGNPGAVTSAAEAISKAGDNKSGEDITVIINALSSAGDKKDIPSVIALLKAVASFKERARNFAGYVLAFADYPFEEVRSEAENALREIRS